MKRRSIRIAVFALLFVLTVATINLSPNTAMFGSGTAAAQQSSPNAPVIDVWYGLNQTFGQPATPTRWINILGKVTDPQGHSNIKTLTASLNGGAAQALSFNANGNRRLDEKGDFNAEIAAASMTNGANTVTLVATDQQNNQTTATVNVQYTAGQTQQLPYVVDWSQTTNIQSVAQVIDGRWKIEGDSIRPSGPEELGYDRLIGIGDINWTDYTVTVPVTINSFDTDERVYNSVSRGLAVGLIIRWKGHYASAAEAQVDVPSWAYKWEQQNLQPRYGFAPMGAFGLFSKSDPDDPFTLRLSGFSSNFGTPIDSSGNVNRDAQIGKKYIFKLRVQSNASGPGTYAMKVWEDGQPEPQEWDFEGTGVQNELKGGSLLLVAHHVDASFGKVTVSPNSSDQLPTATPTATVTPTATITPTITPTPSASPTTTVTTTPNPAPDDSIFLPFVQN
jgi:hypothetical protein